MPVKPTLIILVLLSAIFVSVGTYEHYRLKPIFDFCEDINIGISSSDVIKHAKKSSFLLFSDINPTDEMIRIFNQQSPWGRYGCELNFSEMKLISKRIFEAD